MARAAIHHTEEQSPRPSPQAVPEFCLVVGCRLSWDNAGVTETISANQSYKEGSIAPAQILPTTGQRVWWSRDEGRGGGGVGRGRGLLFFFSRVLNLLGQNLLLVANGTLLWMAHIQEVVSNTNWDYFF